MDGLLVPVVFPTEAFEGLSKADGVIEGIGVSVGIGVSKISTELVAGVSAVSVPSPSPPAETGTV